MTHPFHPLFGREFELLTKHRNVHEERVICRFLDGEVRHLARSWTSLDPEPPFVVVSAGRAWIRPEDLLELVKIVDFLRHQQEIGPDHV